jgi:hypothetical protein
MVCSMVSSAIERVEGDVLGVAAGDNAGFVFAAELESFGGAVAVFEERSDVLGDADFFRAAEAWQDFRGIMIVQQEARQIEEFANGGAELIEIAFDDQAVADGDQIDAWGNGFFRGTEVSIAAAFEPDEGGFHVFAGAEAGGAEVRAGAGKSAGGQVADLDLIGQTAGGSHREGGEDGMGFVEGMDRVFFIAGTLDAAEDFHFVGRAPVAGGWLGNRLRLFSGGFFRGHGGNGRWSGISGDQRIPDSSESEVLEVLEIECGEIRDTESG